MSNQIGSINNNLPGPLAQSPAASVTLDERIRASKRREDDRRETSDHAPGDAGSAVQLAQPTLPVQPVAAGFGLQGTFRAAPGEAQQADGTAAAASQAAARLQQLAGDGVGRGNPAPGEAALQTPAGASGESPPGPVSQDVDGKPAAGAPAGPGNPGAAAGVPAEPGKPGAAAGDPAEPGKPDAAAGDPAEPAKRLAEALPQNAPGPRAEQRPGGAQLPNPRAAGIRANATATMKKLRQTGENSAPNGPAELKYAFKSWGAGHGVTVQMSSGALHLQPSSPRVETALTEARRDETWKVENVDTSTGDDTQKRRGKRQ